MANNAITFLLNNEVRTLTDYDPSMTVLDYLRRVERKTGTKEGCASGDCGACTVVLRNASGHYQTINSCICLLPVLNGKQLITVEDLKENGTLHGTQHSLVEMSGTQCGFCTPGFVMSNFALHKNEEDPSRKDILEAFAGNLCRCTGYRSIIDAAAKKPEPDQFDRDDAETLYKLASLPTGTTSLKGKNSECFLPSSIEELAERVEGHPDARILAGGTDFGVEVTQGLSVESDIIYVGNVPDLQVIEEGEDWLDIGAAVTYSEALPVLHKLYPEYGALIERLGSMQIRHQGTIAGNVGNASPVGDMPPVLIALDAKLVLRKSQQQREINIEDFFKDYKVTDLQVGEFIERIRIPMPVAGKQLKVYKISKRLDDDISAVLAVFNIELEDNKVKHIRTGFGGLAAIPKRAQHCEQALLGQPWNESTVKAAMTALANDFKPLTDVRASDEYRLSVAQNLLRKCYLEMTQPDQDSRVTFYDAATSEKSHA